MSQGNWLKGMKRAARVLALAALLAVPCTGADAAALHSGDNGQAVVEVQRQLLQLGYDVSVDGNFGPLTEQAVKAFQQANGLNADGVVGNATYTALFQGSEPETSRGFGTLARRLLGIAGQLQGVPYVWGGSSPGGFDCSGFVSYVFACAGIDLPRTADTQFEVGTPVAKEDLIPGDLVFFSTYMEGPSHVGIYWGDGQFIHASSGQGVVCFDSLDRDYRIQTYIGARRITA